MTEFHFLTADFFDQDDVIAKLGFKRIGNFALGQAKGHILEFLDKRRLPVHLVITAVGFRAGILRVENGLCKKARSFHHLGLELFKAIDGFLFFLLGYARFDDNLSDFHFRAKHREFIFGNSVKE